MPDDDLGPALRAATHRLVRTVDRLPDDDWAAPSLLPGWTRGHLVAHLALNAEGLAGCVEGALSGDPVPMYASADSRSEEIEDLSGTEPAELRERLLGSTTRIADAVAQLGQHVRDLPADQRDDVLATSVERDPGGRRFALGDVAALRLREVEIHHADLDAGYTAADWDAWFSADVVEAMSGRPVPVADCVLVPIDDPRRWTLGAGGPAVRGPLSALAWWTTGRPAGPDVTSEGGALPRTETW